MYGSILKARDFVEQNLFEKQHCEDLGSIYSSTETSNILLLIVIEAASAHFVIIPFELNLFRLVLMDPSLLHSQ